MQSRCVCCWLLALATAVTGCNRSQPLQPTAAIVAPVPAPQSVTTEPVVVPVHHEVTSDGPRIRIHLTMVQIQGSQPFPKELPDLWSTNEASRVLSTDEITTAVTAAEATGIARGRACPILEVASGEPGNWSAAGDANGLIVTPTLGPDGLIQISFAPPQDQTDNTPATANASDATLGENETLVVLGPTSTGFSTEITRLPFLGDLPFVGPLVFSSKKMTKETNKCMYLVRCEAVPQ